MIDGTEPTFPNNVVELLASGLLMVDSDFRVFKRPLRRTDPNYCIGVFGSLWQPDEESLEIGHAAPNEPTLSEYQIGVQILVKDGDEERGLRIHSIASKRARSVLYRREDLRLALRGLAVTDSLGSTERTRRFGVRNQRYMNNDVDGMFVYLSTLDFWLETETI